MIPSKLFVLVLTLLFPQSGAPVSDCGCEAASNATIAVVDGEKIEASTIAADVATRVALYRTALDQLRARMVQAAITERLLDAAAKDKGVSSGDLVRHEIMDLVAPPTDADVKTYFDQTYGDEPGSFERRAPEIRQFLLEKRRESAYFAFTQSLRAAAKIDVIIATPKPPASEEERSLVIARVNGQSIRLGEIEDRVLPASFELRRKIYLAQRAALDQRIEDILLAHEAGRRGMTKQDLLDADVGEKAHIVDAKEAEAYYSKHADELGGRPFADVRDRVIEFLQQVEDDRAVDAYVAALRARTTVTDLLVEPAPPSQVVDAPDRPWIGSASAAVTIVEFADFQCPTCAAASASARSVVAAHPGSVRLVARNFPLPQHARSFAAAEAAEAAAAQGKFWPYAALLFANQEVLTDERLKQLAGDAGLDVPTFVADVAAHRFKERVERDVSDGNRLGILATPAFYVNGRFVEDASDTALEAAVQDALDRASTSRSASAATHDARRP